MGNGAYRLGLVGLGKIARDQHVPAIAANARFDLAAIASRHATLEGVPHHTTIVEMIAADPRLAAVTLCTPPEGRYQQARAALEAGLHVMLEKPPAATLTEVAELARLAQERRLTLFATWHSREAAGVAGAREWLSGREIRSVRITWKEDIRRWHPGQEWILAAGGFGVFDPGINALSIATRILPQPLLLEAAKMGVPEGRMSPLTATLMMRTGGAPAVAEFDFLQTGPQTWDIEIDTDAGQLKLGLGGSELKLPGKATAKAPDREYPGLYARFAELIDRGESDVDMCPLQLVADAFLIAERHALAPFEF